MNDLIVKNFEGGKVYNFIWRNKPCWIAVDVAKTIGYKDESSTVIKLVKREIFKVGIEYEILTKQDLKEFKEVFAEHIPHLKHSARIIIFYEEGLYGFLAASQMPKGVEFRTWIRREVVPSIREKGYYSINNNEEIQEEININSKEENIVNDTTYSEFNDKKLDAYRMALESAKIFEPLLNNITKDSTYKFLYLKKMFVDAGIDLPKFIDEELF